MNRRQLLRLGAMAAVASTARAPVMPAARVASTLPSTMSARIEAVGYLMSIGAIPPARALRLLGLPELP